MGGNFTNNLQRISRNLQRISRNLQRISRNLQTVYREWWEFYKQFTNNYFLQGNLQTDLQFTSNLQRLLEFT